MNIEERLVIREADEPVKQEDESPSSAQMFPAVIESYARTVYDYDTREAIRDALKISLEPVTAANGKAQIRDWTVDDIDPQTQNEPCLEHEIERLLDLKAYLILDTVRSNERDTPFDRLVEMAGRFFDNRFICVITLVDMGRQYFLTYTPVISRVIPRATGFCRHTILHKDDIMVVNDCREDDRFRDNPFVTDNLRMRFYAGAPIV